MVVSCNQDRVSSRYNYFGKEVEWNSMQLGKVEEILERSGRDPGEKWKRGDGSEGTAIEEHGNIEERMVKLPSKSMYTARSSQFTRKNFGIFRCEVNATQRMTEYN